MHALCVGVDHCNCTIMMGTAPQGGAQTYSGSDEQCLLTAGMSPWLEAQPFTREYGF